MFAAEDTCTEESATLSRYEGTFEGGDFGGINSIEIIHLHLPSHHHAVNGRSL